MRDSARGLANRAWIVLLGSLLLAACAEPPPPAAPLEPVELPATPGINVLMVTFDAFRADNLASYGGTANLTPSMDRFADESIVFRNAYVAGQATPSSFASAFTGRYPFKVFRGWRLLDTQTLARVFDSNGYRTAAFMNNMQLVDSRNYRQGFQVYSVFRDQSDERPLAEFEQFLQARDDQPFFAWVHYINPHSSYDRREGYEAHYDDDYAGEYLTGSGPRVQTYRPSEMRAADVERIKSLYRGEVAFADDRFEATLNLLEAHGLADNTIVVLTADHGEAMDEHGIFGHHQLYEEVIRVPMVLRHPDAPAQAIDARVSNIDLLPTLSTLAGLEYVPGAVDGVDWASGVPPDRPLLSTQMTNKGKLSMALLDGPYKFISWCTEKEDFREELFHLDSDPKELSNRAENRQDADTVIHLWDRFVELAGGEPCTVIADAIEGGDITDVDEETLEALRSLGYIQ